MLTLLAGLACLFLMTGCIDVDVDIAFNADGSGEAIIKITVPSFVPDPTSVAKQVRERLEKTSWRVAELKRVNGGLTLVASKSFSALSEIGQDLGLTGQVDARKLGLLKSRFSLDLLSKGGQFEHFVVSMTVPGHILSTNGEKTGADRVRWDLTGRGATRLAVVSEGISMPGPIAIFNAARSSLAHWLYDTTSGHLSLGTAHLFATIVVAIASVLLILGIFMPAILYVRRLSDKRQLALAHQAPPILSQGPRFCEDCGAPLQPGARFCQKCGGAVGEV